MFIKAYNIKYDTDGRRVSNLPKEITFEINDPNFDPENDIADLISDETGYCIFGCKFKEVK